MKLAQIEDTYGNQVSFNPDLVSVIRKTKFDNTVIFLTGYGAIYTKSSINEIRRAIHDAEFEAGF